MKRFRIGDFAREMGVTADFIKYYEKYELLSPQVDAANGYRFLSFDQSRRLLEIRKYRNLEFKVKEIEGILAGDKAEILAALEGKRAEFARSIAWYRALEHYFEFVREAASGTGGAEDWYVRRMPATLFLPHTDKASFIGTRAVRERFRQWAAYVPLVSSTCRVKFDAEASRRGETPFGDYSYGLSVLAEHADLLGLSRDWPVQAEPERRCLECRFDEPLGHPDRGGKPFLEGMLRIARENSFRFAGDLYAVFVMMFTRGGERRALRVYYAPIE